MPSNAESLQPVFAMLLALAGGAVSSFSAMAQSAPTRPVVLGEPVALATGVQLRVGLSLDYILLRTVPLVGGDSLKPGMAVTLAFENPGTEAVEQLIAASRDRDDSQITVVVDGRKEITPLAMRFAAERYAFVPVTARYGILVRGCVDNNAVGFGRGSKQVAVGSLFCIEPGEEDRIEVVFRREGEPEALEVRLKGCRGCPDEPIRIDGTLALRLAAARGDLATLLSVVEALDNQHSLAFVAMSDLDLPIKVRQAAVGRTTESEVLARVALRARDPEVRLTAWEALDGQPLPSEVLTTLVRQSSDSTVRVGAVRRLADPLLLADLARESSKRDVIRAAVDKVDDPKLLAGLLVDAHLSIAHVWALEKIEDEATLLGIIRDERVSEYTRGDVVEKLVDPAVLADLARTGPVPPVREAAIKKVEDPDLLAEVARHDPDPSVRRAAIRRLTDQSVLAEIATGDAESRVRVEAVEQLTDRAVLERIAEEDPQESVRGAAKHRLLRLPKD